MEQGTRSTQAPIGLAERLARYGAGSALASGILAALSAVFLVLFYAFEAPAILESGDTNAFAPAGRTNDALLGLAALAAIPAAFRLHQSWRMKTGRSSTASTASLALGVTSMIGLGIFLLLFAVGLISAKASGFSTIGLGGLGLWVLLVSAGRADNALRGRLRWIGIVTGIGNLLLAAAFVGAGGTEAVDDPEAVFRMPLLLVGFLAGVIASEIGYPIWAIWLGRRLRAMNAAA
ncbi:MAG TPA: hypothetical protein VEX41_05225 [Candidatus Eisenbacteria bacterium]|nr:hypothetical protein [Candidatus Eisenbacteria bacterium]